MVSGCTLWSFWNAGLTKGRAVCSLRAGCSFRRRYAQKWRDEAEGVAHLFRLLDSTAFPLGAVRLNDLGAVTEHDQDVIPYDFTLYSAVLCAESMRFYWTTYRNAHIRYVEAS